MFLIICKGKEKLEKRRKERSKDEEKTHVLIEGEVQMSIYAWMCVHACVVHHCLNQRS